MEDIKNIIDDLAIAALEQSTKIAGAAVLSVSGDVLYQTENFDLASQGSILINVVQGASKFTISGYDFTVNERSADSIIAISDMGMGYDIITPFQGGFLVVYAMPGAKPQQIVTFLREFCTRLSALNF